MILQITIQSVPRLCLLDCTNTVSTTFHLFLQKFLLTFAFMKLKVVRNVSHFNGIAVPWKTESIILLKRSGMSHIGSCAIARSSHESYLKNLLIK